MMQTAIIWPHETFHHSENAFIKVTGSNFTIRCTIAVVWFVKLFDEGHQWNWTKGLDYWTLISMY